MPILREVVTRFKFDTDEAGAKKVERRTNQMKRGVKSLAGLFGIGLGVTSVRALFKMGIALDQATFNFKRFTGLGGTGLEQMKRQFEGVKNAIDLIRPGAGKGLRVKDFFTAGAGFAQIFGRGKKQQQDFVKTFEFAAKLSRVTGQNVLETFKQITEGIETGNFSFLADISGTTREEIQQIRDIEGLIGKIGFGGETGRQRRFQKFLEIAQVSTGAINRDLKVLPKSMLESQSAAGKFKKIMDDLGKILVDVLVPALEKLNILLSKVVDTSDKIKSQGVFSALITDPAVSIQKSLSPGALGATSDTLLDKIRSGRIDPTRTIVPPGIVKRAKQLGPLPGGEGATIFNTTITINGAMGTDVMLREVGKAVGGVVQNASRAFVPTEER